MASAQILYRYCIEVQEKQRKFIQHTRTQELTSDKNINILTKRQNKLRHTREQSKQTFVHFLPVALKQQSSVIQYKNFSQDERVTRKEQTSSIPEMFSIHVLIIIIIIIFTHVR